MFGLRRGNKRPFYGALIDIGSGTIGVAIVVSKADSASPELVYTHRIVMRITEHEGGIDVDLRRVRESLISATLVLSQEGLEALRKYDKHAKIEDILVTCAAPWAYTLVRNVRYENDTPFKITETIIADLVESAESEMITRIQTETGMASGSFEIVERTTVDLMVNDYPVTDPTHVSGSTIALSHVAGVVPNEIIRAIEEVQDKLFPNTTLQIHTSVLAMYCVIREIFPHIASYTIIDVTGEATECALIQNGTLTENAFIPYGSISLTRDLLKKTKRPLGDIQTHLRAYGDGEINETDFVEDISSYKTQVRALIARMREHILFPTNVVITAYRPYSSLFSRVITTAITEELNKPPTVHAIEASLIDTVSGSVGDDVYLALYARFFHKVHSSLPTKES